MQDNVSNTPDTPNPDPSASSQAGIWRFGLRLKMAIVTGVAMLSMSVILGYSQYSTARDILNQEVVKRARALTASLAKNADYVFFTGDQKQLKEFLRSMLGQEDVAYVYLIDSKQKKTLLSGANAVEGLRDSKKESKDSDFVGSVDLKGLFDSVRVDPDNIKEVTAREVERQDVGRVLDIAAPVFFRVAQDDNLLFGTDDVADDRPTKGELQKIGVVQVGYYLRNTERMIAQNTFRGLVLVLLVFAAALFIVTFFVRYALSPIERMAQATQRIARGDLRQDVAIQNHDEVGQLGLAFNDMLRSVRDMLTQMREAAENIDSSTNEILTAATQQSAGASEQAASISETGATVKEINQTAQQTAEKANSVIDISQRSEEISGVGQRAVEDSIAGIEELRGQVEAIAQNIVELSERTQQIGEIITTVNDLAEQSNLLALNASIEAAKAGEQGKGFAVVAVEMRNLAEQSKQATAQVRTILSDIQRATRAAVSVTEEGSRKAEASVELANGSGENIRRLSDVIRESSMAAKQISALANQQSVGIEQISAAMTNIKLSTSESVQGTKQIERALQDLKSLSDRMSAIVNRYEA